MLFSSRVLYSYKTDHINPLPQAYGPIFVFGIDQLAVSCGFPLYTVIYHSFMIYVLIDQVKVGEVLLMMVETLIEHAPQQVVTNLTPHPASCIHRTKRMTSKNKTHYEQEEHGGQQWW